jgi:hypothetical protein
LREHIPPNLLQDVDPSEGRLFGKPVWDFQYPDSSIFVAEPEEQAFRDDLVGCAVATTRPGDVVFIPSGSTYPLILQPMEASEHPRYTIRGFAYIDTVMRGDWQHGDTLAVKIC